MTSLKEEGYILIDSLFETAQIDQLKSEFNALKVDKLENKNIEQSASYDAGQRRFEIMNPPLLTQLYKNTPLNNLMGIDTKAPTKANNRCGYYFYLEESYIKPHFDHLLSDCMLLIGLTREYGSGEPKGGILKLYIPKTIAFNRAQQQTQITDALRVVEIDLKVGAGILVAGGHILHECTPLEKGGTRLICGMGYTFQRS